MTVHRSNLGLLLSSARNEQPYLARRLNFMPPGEDALMFTRLRYRYLNLMKGFPDDEPAAKRIVAAVLWPWNVTWREICGPRRNAFLVKPRHEAILAVAVAFPEWSYPRIGRLFHRDHTTILNALDAFAKRVAHGEVQPLPRVRLLPKGPKTIRMQKSPVSSKRDLVIFKRFTAGASADAIASALHMAERDVYRALMRVRQMSLASQSLQNSEV